MFAVVVGAEGLWGCCMVTVAVSQVGWERPWEGGLSQEDILRRSEGSQ